MHVRVSPDGKAIAIATGPAVTRADWYVFHEDNGGSYSDGIFEGVADWTPHDFEALPPPPEDDNMSDTNTEETPA